MSAPVAPRGLGGGDVPTIVAVLCDAFADYPVMRYVLADAGSSYAHHLPILVRFFVMARMLRGEPMLGIGEGSALWGVALMSRPGSAAAPVELEGLRGALWGQLGAAARQRYEAFGAAHEPFAVRTSHFHLNMIGVRKTEQGRGLSRRLLDAVHRRSREDRDSQGVTLTTEDPAKVSFYEHFGYELRGHVRVAPELETWAFYRPDR